MSTPADYLVGVRRELVALQDIVNEGRQFVGDLNRLPEWQDWITKDTKQQAKYNATLLLADLQEAPEGELRAKELKIIHARSRIYEVHHRLLGEVKGGEDEAATDVRGDMSTIAGNGGNGNAQILRPAFDDHATDPRVSSVAEGSIISRSLLRALSCQQCVATGSLCVGRGDNPGDDMGECEACFHRGLNCSHSRARNPTDPTSVAPPPAPDPQAPGPSAPAKRKKPGRKPKNPDADFHPSAAKRQKKTVVRKPGRVETYEAMRARIEKGMATKARKKAAEAAEAAATEAAVRTPAVRKTAKKTQIIESSSSSDDDSNEEDGPTMTRTRREKGKGRAEQAAGLSLAGPSSQRDPSIPRNLEMVPLFSREMEEMAWEFQQKVVKELSMLKTCPGTRVLERLDGLTTLTWGFQRRFVEKMSALQASIEG